MAERLKPDFKPEEIPAQVEIINIPEIVLKWTEWYPWERFKEDARQNGFSVPNGAPGVYQVKIVGKEELLYIGKSNDLRFRLKQGLVKGKIPHCAGKGIRQHENLLNLVIRWAETEYPEAAEVELLKKYKKKHGKNPTYNKYCWS